MSQFKQDIIDLFNYKKGGHVDHWLYSDSPRKNMSGSQLWQEFLRSSQNYYILPNEIELISNLSSKLSHLSHIDTVIDLGVGGEMATVNKAIPVIKGLGNVKNYVGVDISKDFVEAACQRVANDLHIHAVQVHGDFYKIQQKMPGQSRLGIMFGSTITNQNMKENDVFPRHDIVTQLEKIGSLIGKGNNLLISFDANEDRDSAINAYENKFWSGHVTGIMYDIRDIAKGDFSADAWVHKKVWGKDVAVIHQCAEATRDQNFTIDEEEFSIRKGDRFVTVNNFKYPVELFKSMCEEAGLETAPRYMDRQNRMCVQELRC